MKISQTKAFKPGYTPITTIEEKELNTLMDFGILTLEAGKAEENTEDKERAYLLVQGEIEIEWEGKKETIKRGSFLDESPWCLHLPANVRVKITGKSTSSEIAVTKTTNPVNFASKLYTQAECASEHRGEGTMNETSTRIVRTVFDKTISPSSNLVVGEVINTPGKWSSYPPHHHKQPEIYYYRFYPENGYGFAQLGHEAVKVQDKDTVKIVRDESHPQVAAPGYAMYYVWVIRHLEGDPYITPTFEPEHLWVTKKDAVIWSHK